MKRGRKNAIASSDEEVGKVSLEKEEEEDEDEEESVINRMRKGSTVKKVKVDDSKAKKHKRAVESESSSSEEEMLSKKPLTSNNIKSNLNSKKLNTSNSTSNTATITTKAGTKSPSISSVVSSNKIKPPTIISRRSDPPISNLTVRRNSGGGTSIASASTANNSHISPTRPSAARAASSQSSYQTHHINSPSTTIPFRVTGNGLSLDVFASDSLELGFDNEIIVKQNKAIKGKGREIKPTAARIENLADANSFISFAFVRNKIPGWSETEVEEETNQKGTELTLKLYLMKHRSKKGSQLVRSSNPLLVGVASITGISQESKMKTIHDLELRAKFTLIRALISPSNLPNQFIEDFNKDLAKALLEESFADDEMTPAQEKDQEGKELFYEYRRLHPRSDLDQLEKAFKNIGSLDFVAKCQKLIELLEKATLSLGNDINDRTSFGSWDGEVNAHLQKILGSIDSFCNKTPEYYPFAIEVLTSLSSICSESNGGAMGSKTIQFWLDSLNSKNEVIEEQHVNSNTVRKKPAMIKNLDRKPTVRRQSLATMQEESMPLVQQEEVIIPEVIMKEVKPVVVDNSKKITEISVDPRKKRPSIVEAEFLPPPSLFLTIPSNKSDDSFHSFTTSPELLSALPELLPPPIPLIPIEKFVPAPRRVKRSSTLVEISPAPHAQQATPSPTPELFSEDRSGLEYIEFDSVLSGPVEILPTKRLTRLSFAIENSSIVSRLAAHITDSSSVDESNLPYRAFAVFRSSEGSIVTNWPLVQISVNEHIYNCFPEDTAFEPVQKVKIPNGFLESGLNEVEFIRWLSQPLPDPFTLSIELYIAYSENWLRAKVLPEDDLREADLYEDYANIEPPQAYSLLDPTTEERMLTAVRSSNCNHFECFDLNTHIMRNQKTAEWLCPHCKASATPSTLRISGWTQPVLDDRDYDLTSSMILARAAVESESD